jgi:hypothetical protein
MRVLDGEMRKVLLGLVILAGAASTACATANAKTTPDRPTLEVPAPPAKVVETTPQPETMPELVPDLPPAQPANTRPSRPASSREPTRTDPKPEATATPPDTSAAPPPPLVPAPQLRTSSTDTTEAAKQVQTTIERARQALNSVDTKQFTKPRRVIYDNAKLMLTQAEDALKKSDFDNAKKLAEKVELTAKELQGR